MHDDRSSASTVLAFLVGGLTGAALAILFAPSSGRETRERLGEKIREGAERGRDVRERVASRGRDVADGAAGYVDKQRGQLERQKDRLAAAVEAGRQAYRDEKEGA